MTAAPVLLGAVNRVGDGRSLGFHLHPDVLLVMAGLGVGYWWAVTRLGPRLRPGEQVVSRRQVVWFSTGLALLWIFAEWPVHDLAEHYSYAVHMVQHEVFTLASAPMLLLGLPTWLLGWLVVGRPWYRAVRFVCRPAVALLLNAAVTGLTHWPWVVNEATHNEWFHFAAHVVLVGSALALWMPLINRVPELPRPSKPALILYLFAWGFMPIAPTLFLIFSTGVIYKAYIPGAAYMGWSATGDQELAGTIMGSVTPLLSWVLAAYVFFSWYGDEERRDATTLPEDLTWDDVERQLATPRPPG